MKTGRSKEDKDETWSLKDYKKPPVSGITGAETAACADTDTGTGVHNIQATASQGYEGARVRTVGDEWRVRYVTLYGISKAHVSQININDRLM